MSANETSPPLCRHLRTKKMYVPSQADGALAKQRNSHGDSFFNCIRTLSVLGCDDDAVHPRACCPGRRCYEA